MFCLNIRDGKAINKLSLFLEQGCISFFFWHSFAFSHSTLTNAYI